MPANNPNAAANLMPFKPGYDERRLTGAWPGWRGALRRTIADGEALFQKLNSLAMGEMQQPTLNGVPATRPVYNEQGVEVGREPVYLMVPPAVQKAAAAELLDRAFGKPVQVVIDLTPTGDGDGEYVPASELTEEERAIVRAIAKRRMLVNRVREGVSGAEPG